MEMNDILQSNNKTYSWEDINNMTNKIVEYVNKNNLQFEFGIRSTLDLVYHLLD